jgi:predicted phage terminase large subunit-like protein
MPVKNSLARAKSELSAYAVALYPPFDLTHHHRFLIDKLEAVVRGEIDRLMVFMPPRFGKSLLTSTLFPAWYLGQYPSRSIIAASYGQELANDFGRRVRTFVDSDLHRLIFPKSRIAEDNAAVHRFGLAPGGNYYAVGVGGAVTGRGADVLLIDDATKDAESAYSTTSRKSLQQWFEHVAYTRLQPGGAIIVIATRWHQDDLPGWLLREHAGDNWQVVSLPAIAEPDDALGRPEGAPLWPSRFPLEALARIREAIGSTAWSALYQQRPVAAEGAIFRKEWLRTYVDPPECFRIIFSLDTAFKTGESNDYSVIAVWGETKTGFYLLDLVRERLDFPSLKSRVEAKAAYWKPHAVLIEDAASGMSLIQVLNQETKLPILPVKALGDKESRASAVSPSFESGKVYLPQQAPWLSDFVDELTSFPAAPHDDMVDATTQALSWLGRQGNYSARDIQTIPRGSTTPRLDGGRGAVPEGWSRYSRPDLDAEIAEDAAIGGGSRAAGVISVFGSQRFGRGRGTW